MKHAADRLARQLEQNRIRTATLHSNRSQSQRLRALKDFKSGAVRILVATDIAARGIDVDGISHVVNYDFPMHVEDYVHRIGRTGRAGRSGEALLFVTPRERHLLRTIEKATRQPVTEMALPSVEDVNTVRVAKFADSITERLASPEVTFFRGLIEDYQSEHDVPLADIAAAIAVMAQDGQSLLLAPEPPRAERPKRERVERDSATEKPRKTYADADERPARQPKVRPKGDRVGYRIDVGRRQKVQPGQIVGALANEGGLSRGDFGHIDIGDEYTIVELPADLDSSVFAKLKKTRVSGQLINLRLDDEPRADKPRGDKPRTDAAHSGAPRRGPKLGTAASKQPAKQTKKPHRKGAASRSD
jgi:ATP-dependent RNA helicase DeaD